MDTGPILAPAAVPGLDADSAETLGERVLAAEHRLYPFALALVARGDARVVDERIFFTQRVNQARELYSPDPDFTGNL